MKLIGVNVEEVSFSGFFQFFSRRNGRDLGKYPVANAKIARMMEHAESMGLWVPHPQQGMLTQPDTANRQLELMCSRKLLLICATREFREKKDRRQFAKDWKNKRKKYRKEIDQLLEKHNSPFHAETIPCIELIKLMNDVDEAVLDELKAKGQSVYETDNCQPLRIYTFDDDRVVIGRALFTNGASVPEWRFEEHNDSFNIQWARETLEKCRRNSTPW